MLINLALNLVKCILNCINMTYRFAFCIRLENDTNNIYYTLSPANGFCIPNKNIYIWKCENLFLSLITRVNQRIKIHIFTFFVYINTTPSFVLAVEIYDRIKAIAWHRRRVLGRAFEFLASIAVAINAQAAI